MHNLFDPQLIGPLVLAMISAACTYFVIIRRTRTELAVQTKSALEAFHEKTEKADLSDRLAFRAEQRAELQLLRQAMKECEVDKAEMIVKQATAAAHIIILEARVKILEQSSK
jgi:DNA-binding transcriptional regulator/RsmH inhibitor MraZ